MASKPPSASDDPIHHLREAADTTKVTEAALRVFAERYPSLELSRLTIVIAAYNEADNIGPVLEEIPAEIAGIGVSTVVIDDGSADDTAAIADKYGAQSASCRSIAATASHCASATALRGRTARPTSRPSMPTASGIRPICRRWWRSWKRTRPIS